jgi:hypothetical protein
MGTFCVTFKLADTQREILGNTAIYLLLVTDPTIGVPDAALDFQETRVTPNPPQARRPWSYVPATAGRIP